MQGWYAFPLPLPFPLSCLVRHWRINYKMSMLGSYGWEPVTYGFYDPMQFPAGGSVKHWGGASTVRRFVCLGGGPCAPPLLLAVAG